MIPDDVVEEVRSRADIVDIIGEFVQLKKAGKDYKGLSPFKDERTPSFYVVPTKGFYHDFSSGESGDVFSFLMKHQGLSFTDAVKFVGARCGVDVRDVRKGGASEDPLRPYYEASAFAKAFYSECLWDDEVGAAARSYLEGRGISKETAERYGLGFAPDEWRAFRDRAALHGLDERLLSELGLLKKSEKRDEPYDALRNRIVFPIETVSGRVVAFGGRLLGQGRKGAPKYLNSPENPVFHKSEILYGLNWAKNHIRREEHALLVEGYMDVVSLGSVGLEAAVAPLGTALTEQHAETLLRYTKKVLLLFDSDSAGSRATYRAADLLLSKGLHPAVVTFPAGQDPDSVAQEGGAQAIQQYLKGAVDVLDRKIQILEERDYFSSIEKTRQALDRLLPTLRAVKDPALRDLYLAKVEERTRVSRATLEAEIKEDPVPVRRPAPRPRQAPVPIIPRRGAEQDLVKGIVKHRAYVEPVAERLGPADFEDHTSRAIFEALVVDPDLEDPSDRLDPPAVKRFEELMADGEPVPSRSAIEEMIARVLQAGFDGRLDAIDARIHGAGSDVEKEHLIQEKLRLTAEKKQLGTDWRKSARNAIRQAKGA
ncbi:MAG: DNA primase [Gemmatimonadetes bacterium]|nr:DNA primase [Gemmatimonadota bacterium]